MLRGRLWINPGLTLDYPVHYKDPCKQCKARYRESHAFAPSVFCGRFCERRYEQTVCLQCGEPYEAGRCLPEKCGMA